MANNYVQPGNVIDYVAAADLTSGAVVSINGLLGIALQDIANGQSGSVQITGVFAAPKVSAAVIAQGETLSWDVSAGAFDDNQATAATGDVTGPTAVAFAAAGAGATSLLVKFTGVPGSVA